MDKEDQKDKTDINEEYAKLMKMEYTYPEPDEDNFQTKMYKKREFYYHKMQSRDKLENYDDIREYRDNVCSRYFELFEHQAFLSNYINPDTPYKGLLIFHGTGTGKCLIYDQRVLIDGKYIKIYEIWDNYASDFRVIDEDPSGEWAIPKKDLHVKSMDQNKRLITNKVNFLYRQKVNEFINVIKLENGSTLKITKKHKLYTENGWTNNFFGCQKILIPNPDKNGKDFVFSKILSITEESYNGYVYDLEIKDHHNFIAEDVLVSNTCAAIAIAEKFKDMVQKYGTKIYVLVSGPLIKDNWKNELLTCTGETYLKKEDATMIVGEAQKEKANKLAINTALQYYRLMSYRSFYKKVLGEKIREVEKVTDTKVKKTYRKTKEGEFERDVAIDRLYNLNNSLIIVDEAHALTDNQYGEALKQIVKNSHNLKVILLTATPMKNLADDIVELINFIRPPREPMSRDKIFTSDKNHLMDFKPGGAEYLKKMTQGYVSYLRGADPLTFAQRVEKGVVPEGLLFTKVIKCKMLPFQRKAYDEVVQVVDDTLDRRSGAVANFAFPGLSKDQKEVQPYVGREGLNTVKNQIKTSYELLNKKIGSDILKDEETGDGDYIYLSEVGKTINGAVLRKNNLKHFSAKFYKALDNLEKLVWGKKDPRTAFIYANLVKVGIELFHEILLENGYLEFDENPTNYKIKSNTVCYFCGKSYKDHQKMDLVTMAKLSRDKPAEKVAIPEHTFAPATFISITGKSTEETVDVIPEDKRKILDNVFSALDNKNGRYLKFVLGSKVMQEGISLKNVAEVHILDVAFNLGKVDQVIGRAIRSCSHYPLMSEKNPYPVVKVYKYVVSVDKGLSTEEELYKKAELKYIMIKKVERVLKKSAIDCPHNRSGNVFPEELAKYKDCYGPTDKPVKGKDMCPAKCDYTTCDFKCDDPTLNKLYFDPNKNNYKDVKKENLDYTTFTQSLAKNEIELAKNVIKDMFRVKHVYTLPEIVETVRSSYREEKKELFEEFFVFKGLDQLIPITENDFNNFKDTIFDKFNNPGYLIYRNKYYIFQPFNQPEDVPMYYRSTFDKQMTNQLTLHNYMKNTEKFRKLKDKSLKKKEKATMKKVYPTYDFESVMEYYDNRNENFIVGIIDKQSSRRRTRDEEELQDVFKIREKRAKILDKKRATGLPSLKGAVCSTSKDKEYLENIGKKINANLGKSSTRTDICDKIKDRLLFLEKYSTGNKKLTYIMIPKNHPIYPFPLNLEDRVKYIKDQIANKIKFPIKINTKTIKKKVSGENVQEYVIEIQHESKLNDFKQFLESLDAKFIKDKYIIEVN